MYDFPIRSSCCGDNHSSHRGVCCYRLLQHSLCVHYRIIPNYFKVMSLFFNCISSAVWTQSIHHCAFLQAEWFWCELDVWSRVGDPGSTGETPGRLPSLHPHADIRHHPHHCCWSLLVTAWNPQCGTPGPNWVRVSGVYLRISKDI